MRTKILSSKLFSSILQSDNARTKLAIRNIIGSLFVKGGSVFISLLLVPLTIKYVNATQYGIWLALSSIIAWFSFFDIGLGNGLKNKLAEALAKDNKELAKTLVSTTYAILCLLVVAFVVIFLVVHHFVNWSSVLSLPASMEPELRNLISLVFVLFCLQFVLQTIVVILTAHQQVSTASFLSFLGNLLSLAIIFILTKTTEGNLLYLGLAFSATPLVVYFFSSVFYFKTRYKLIAPSFKSVNFSYSRTLMGLGVKFFIIQIAAIILYQTTNILLLKLYDADEVTSYNINYKYFGIITMVFSIVMSPFWVAFSDAYHKNDIPWIKQTINKLLKIWGLIAVGGLLMLLVSVPVIKFWVGDSVRYSLHAGFAMWLYFISSSFGSIFVFFINGTGKVFLQFLTSILAPILFIPLAIFLGRYLGQAGLIYSSIICNVYGIFIAPLQYRKIIQQNATGVWNK
ncbi:oligosaccharide flippase family protein [Flavihumibacter sp. CACIAM 22H1]|uniref:lipopolysaccharide biosynthesis protein n=1 Tax=Flavihumibacter sp. CACIAM 22H1 TaxID=1812911 RepID=UPI0007A86D2E|nr:oligosaccharide flippase family protein [Flavihumibacter sp. CACIAM 22H1]KYP13048.1 MAG: hypothetical protein A1D16_05855 [Flavihumibacter sp. CACIAM 22H1]